MTEEHTERTEETTVENPQDAPNEEQTEQVTREETTTEKPVLNDPQDLAQMPPGAPQAVERETEVRETRESDDS